MSNAPAGGILSFNTRRSENTLTPHNTFWSVNYESYASQANTYMLSLLRVITTNGVYPINRYNQNLYVVETGGNTFSVQIGAGNYNASELAALLTTALNAGSAFGGWTVVEDTVTSKFTIALAAHTFTFANGNYNMYDVLGFYPSNFTVATSQTADAHYNLGGTQFVEVRMSLANRLNYFGEGYDQVIDTVPVTVGFGEPIFWAPQAPTYPSWIVSNLQFSDVRMQLRDDHDNPWELPATDSFQILFSITPLY